LLIVRLMALELLPGTGAVTISAVIAGCRMVGHYRKIRRPFVIRDDELYFNFRNIFALVDENHSLFVCH
jgi:hypothetical protein